MNAYFCSVGSRGKSVCFFLLGYYELPIFSISQYKEPEKPDVYSIKNTYPLKKITKTVPFQVQFHDYYFMSGFTWL